MKVYCLWTTIPHVGNVLRGVYADETRANQAMEEARPQRDEWTGYVSWSVSVEEVL